MYRVKLRVQGLTNSQIQSGAYALILAEDEGPRRLPVIVGTAEAQSIAIALEGIIPPRPLTHDLFAGFARTFHITLKEVYIYKFEDGVYYSQLVFDAGANEVRMDSRTSDAIALAMRMECDIYTTEDILRECGVVLEEIIYNDDEDPEDVPGGDLSDDYLSDYEPEDLENEEEKQKWLTMLDEYELSDRLEEAIKKEHYENAKLYKDEMQRRKNEKEE